MLTFYPSALAPLHYRSLHRVYSTPTIRVADLDKKPVDGPRLSSDVEKHQDATVAPTPLPSNVRRYALLGLFSMAQFMDVYLSTAVLIGIAGISKDLEMSIAGELEPLHSMRGVLRISS